MYWRASLMVSLSLVLAACAARGAEETEGKTLASLGLDADALEQADLIAVVKVARLAQAPGQEDAKPGAGITFTAAGPVLHGHPPRRLRAFRDARPLRLPARRLEAARGLGRPRVGRRDELRAGADRPGGWVPPLIGAAVVAPVEAGGTMR